MANREVDRGTVLEIGPDISDLTSYQVSKKRDRSGRLEWPIMMISLSSIVDASPAQTRQEVFDPDKYPEDAELSSSIREYGVIEPILVLRISNDTGDPHPQYQLIAGDRRRHAAAHVGLEMIPAIIRQGSEEAPLLTLAENTGRRDLTPYEKAIALSNFKNIDGSDLTYRDLAQKTGISLSSVSNLLNAYNQSPPALRRLFAEGMASRAVVELQGIFTKFDESKQVDLSGKLSGLSQGQVSSIIDLFNRDIDIDTAIDAVIASDKTPKLSTPRSKENVQKQDHSNDNQSLQLDKGQIIALSELTGASQKAIKGVISKAETRKSNMDSVFLACAFIGRGGNPRNALKKAVSLSQNSKASRLVRKHLVHLNKVKQMIVNTDNVVEQEFLNTIFFGR